MSITTTDATPTTLRTTTITDNAVTFVEVFVHARAASGNCAFFIRRAAYKSNAGTVLAIGGVDATYTAKDVAGWDCTLGYSGAQVSIVVTGSAGETVKWESERFAVLPYPALNVP